MGFYVCVTQAYDCMCVAQGLYCLCVAQAYTVCVWPRPMP